MNYVHLLGNLTENPKITVTASGVTKCSFRLAVSRKHTNQQGEREADFLTVIAWRKLGETCGKYLSKGRKCAVTGSIQTRSYDATDGSGKRYVTEIIADDVEFVGANPQGKPDDPPTQANSAAADGFTEVQDDDLPY